MNTYVSLLRGINVSGKNIVKMEVLKIIFIELGFENVKTYIQSGNIVFQTLVSDLKYLEDLISDKIFEMFSFNVPVFVIKKDDLGIVLNQNPYLKLINNHEKLYVTFLSDYPENELLSKFMLLSFLPDQFQIINKVVYLHCPDSYGNSKVNNNLIEKKLKVNCTTRNLKTLNALIEM